jgi:hypothetical protein
MWKIFESTREQIGGWKKQRNDELHCFNFLLNIIWVITSGRIRRGQLQPAWGRRQIHTEI